MDLKLYCIVNEKDTEISNTLHTVESYCRRYKEDLLSDVQANNK